MASVGLQNIYEVVMNRIKDVPPRTFWIDLDIGQLDGESETMPIKYPAVLLKFADVIWKDTAAGYQMGLVNVAVKFAYKFKAESQFFTASTLRSEVASCITMLSDIHNA